MKKNRSSVCTYCDLDTQRLCCNTRAQIVDRSVSGRMWGGSVQDAMTYGPAELITHGLDLHCDSVQQPNDREILYTRPMGGRLIPPG